MGWTAMADGGRALIPAGVRLKQARNEAEVVEDEVARLWVRRIERGRRG